MKQKYKVFINDQEIVFQLKKSSGYSENMLLPEDLNPVEIYRYLQNAKLPDNTKYVMESDAPEQSFFNFISSFQLIEAAGGIVRKKNKSGEILMIFRLGKWDLPKGKIDAGETPEEAALREIEEECGISHLHINSKIDDTYHIYEHKGKTIVKRTHWFLMVSADNSKPVPQSAEGIDEVRWVSKSDVQKLLPYSYASISDLLQNTVLNG